MPRHQRALVVFGIGGLIAILGVIFFAAAHAIATPGPGIPYNGAERDLEETLWAAFGISLLMGGVIVAAVGLWAWCRDGV